MEEQASVELENTQAEQDRANEREANYQEDMCINCDKEKLKNGKCPVCDKK